MLLFRSEEHLGRWLASEGVEQGAVLTLAQTWELAKAWYPDRRDPELRVRTVAESQEVLRSVGLVDPFWTLATPKVV